MKTILLIHGANLNMLGKRDKGHYGTMTLRELENRVRVRAKELGFNVIAFQSNHEGEIINFLQARAKRAVGIIINPGAYTHYSYAIHDALLDTGLPAIEVHLSRVTEREEWRARSVIAPACRAVFAGEKIGSYEKAVEEMANILIGKKPL